MNIYDFPSGALNEEFVTALHDNDEVIIERIISTGNISPENFWYDQDKNEFIVLIEGEAKLEIKSQIEPEVSNNELREVLLNRGDTFFIPAHLRHRVTYTSTNPACVWLCIFW